MILVVEDEPGILDVIDRGLRRHGHEVLCVTDGEAGLRHALDPGVELMILDLMLPLKGGLEVLAELRGARPELPVIVLTARGQVEDRVTGLDAGAIDYLVKPFSIDELAARVRAHLRSAKRGETVLSVGDVDVDLLSRNVRAGSDGTPVRLSTTEFELLVHLMRHAGQVLGREQILRTVWGYQHDPGTNVLDVYIGYLRRKLGSTDTAARITTIRSLGYRFDPVPR